MNKSTRPEGDYILLDSGDEAKLEQVGPYRLVRPASQAVWKRRLSENEWRQVDAIYRRTETGSGKWEWKRPIPRKFPIVFANLSFWIKLTDFGHLGLFPEQADNWTWMRDLIRQRMARTNNRNLTVLNLFAYTGGSTLAASQAGAHVVHVDAAKGVVDWARDNAKESHLDERPIRWLVDEALKFAQREVRRGRKYQGIILDPPSFGRGPKGEVFKIEKHLLPLLDACQELLADDALFFLLSCHTPGFTPTTLRNQLLDILGDREGVIEQGEMLIPGEKGRFLPSGVYGRWQATK
jgi:23S rRNA (cytosine1962-C5)-methyltransferase